MPVDFANHSLDPRSGGKISAGVASVEFTTDSNGSFRTAATVRTAAVDIGAAVVREVDETGQKTTLTGTVGKGGKLTIGKSAVSIKAVVAGTYSHDHRSLPDGTQVTTNEFGLAARAQALLEAGPSKTKGNIDASAVNGVVVEKKILTIRSTHNDYNQKPDTNTTAVELLGVNVYESVNQFS